jgi:hypothetical protein
MKKHFLFLIGALFTLNIVANINYIDISKISDDAKHLNAFNYIKENVQYYEHRKSEWPFEKPKQEFIDKLHENYATFSSISKKNTELYLLLGDISHYLYNLDDSVYFKNAVSNYNSAIKKSPNDYRSYWFLGFHYALSNEPAKATDNFILAEKLLPKEHPADFWNEYAMATAISNMPSHSIYAMDRAKKILGKAGSFEEQLGETVLKRIEPVDKFKSFKKKEIWSASFEEKSTFISRPLGIKILIDSTWNLKVTDYEKGQTAFLMTPPDLKNKNGKEISYTIAIIMKTASNKESLGDYINDFVSKYATRKKITFSDKYNGMITYEIQDKTMYKTMGGAHLYMIGIERFAPKYPGLLLEKPMNMPVNKTGELSYYEAATSQDRFKGKIFYAILLDCSEDIHEEAITIFKNLFDNQIVIE